MAFRAGRIWKNSHTLPHNEVKPSFLIRRERGHFVFARGSYRNLLTKKNSFKTFYDQLEAGGGARANCVSSKRILFEIVATSDART